MAHFNSEQTLSSAEYGLSVNNDPRFRKTLAWLLISGGILTAGSASATFTSDKLADRTSVSTGSKNTLPATSQPSQVPEFTVPRDWPEIPKTPLPPAEILSPDELKIG